MAFWTRGPWRKCSMRSYIDRAMEGAEYETIEKESIRVE